MSLISNSKQKHRLQMLVPGEELPEEDAPLRRCPTCARELLPGEETCIRDGARGVVVNKPRPAGASATSFMLPGAGAAPRVVPGPTSSES